MEQKTLSTTSRANCAAAAAAKAEEASRRCCSNDVAEFSAPRETLSTTFTITLSASATSSYCRSLRLLLRALLGRLAKNESLFFTIATPKSFYHVDENLRTAD